MTEIAASVAGALESITVTRVPYFTPNMLVTVSWRAADGSDNGHHWYIPYDGLDDDGERPPFLAHRELLATHWLTERDLTCPIDTGVSRRTIATVYLRRANRSDEIVARQCRAYLGICDQWKDRSCGNYAEDGEWGLLTDRYFGDSGPGVYELPIIEHPGFARATDPVVLPGGSVVR